jgi:uncharacterized membrane protein YhaH (DUF805 family)
MLLSMSNYKSAKTVWTEVECSYYSHPSHAEVDVSTYQRRWIVLMFLPLQIAWHSLLRLKIATHLPSSSQLPRGSLVTLAACLPQNSVCARPHHARPARGTHVWLAPLLQQLAFLVQFFPPLCFLVWLVHTQFLLLRVRFVRPPVLRVWLREC